MAWVTTKTPGGTELALMELLPQKHWIEINELLVGYGQRVCTPTSPRCSVCVFASECPAIDVKRRR